MARSSISLLAGSAMLLSALTASAQEPRPERPNRGVYAGGTDAFQQVVTVNASGGVGYDTNARYGQQESGLSAGINAPASPSVYTALSGGLSYSSRKEPVSLLLSLSSSARRYETAANTVTTSHAAQAGTSFALGTKTRVNLGGAVSYQPYRAFLPFAVDAAQPELAPASAPDQDFGTVRRSYYTYTTNAGFTRQLSRRASFTAGYSRQTTDFSTTGEGVMSQTGSFRFTRGISRRLGLHIGYGYTQANYAIDDRLYENHNIDTGLDYSRDISITRRTKLSFSTGGAAVRQEDTMRLDATGTATLTREIGRSWMASLNYVRNVGFLESVREPLFYDGLTAGFGGLIAPRLSFQSGLGVTVGQIGMTRSTPLNRGFNALRGTAGLNMAISRNLAVGLNYAFYRYGFDTAQLVAAGMPSQFNRHTVSLMLNTWIPVMQRGRKADVTR